MLPNEMDDVVVAVGDRIHAGLVSGEVGYQAIGAVAAWRSGHHELALDGMSPDMVAAVEQALRDAGLEVPWPPQTAAGTSSERGTTDQVTRDDT